MRSDTYHSGNGMDYFQERLETCPECDGAGEIYDEKKGKNVQCPECQGFGEYVIIY